MAVGKFMDVHGIQSVVRRTTPLRPSLLPPSVDIRVLGACNLRCPFCFGPRHHLGPKALLQLVELLPRLRSSGVETLVVTGGEPLLVKALPTLLAGAKTLGFHTVLSTNGTKFPLRHTEIAPHLDWVALPLDGPSAAVHDAARPGAQSSYDLVLESLRITRDIYPNVGVKLGTVVTAQNFSTVPDIPSSLPPELAPDTWKIYEMSFSNYGADNRGALELDTTMLEATIEKALLTAAEAGWTTTVYRNSERDGKYLFIEPSGDVLAIVSGIEERIGNVFENFEAVVAAWSEYVDLGRLRDNVAVTYPSTRSRPAAVKQAA